jgi:hypothetical protein
MIHLSITLFLSIKAIAAFDYRENSPASLFPQNQAAIDVTLPDAVSNPACLPMIQFPYLHFSGSKPYTLDELYATILRAGYGNGVFGVQVSWNRFGFDQYLENIADAAVGYRPVRYVSLGAAISYYNISIQTQEASISSHLCDGRVSMLIAPFEWTDLSFQYENIASILIKKRRDLLYPGWSAGAALKPIKGLTLTWNINRTPYGYVNSISASVNILKYLSVRAGYARESATYSASVSFIYKYISASYGLKYHPHLGFTHSVGVTLALFEIPVEPLNYSNMLKRIHELHGVNRIDINSCSLDEIMQIPDMEELFAERIIKYRNSTGTVTKDTFVQVGMKEQDIQHLLKYITGLTADTVKPKVIYRSRNEYEKAQKEIFKKLLTIGLTASAALELSEMAVKGQEQKIRNKVNGLPAIDADKKKKILKLCSDPF